MKIIINDKEIEIIKGETLLEAARRIGCPIPALCYAKDAVHKPSCMVCAVQNRTNRQIIPSCSAYPAEGMAIETDNAEIRQIRTLSLELLLSDHRADCEAPCSTVCPKKLDIEQMLCYYDVNQYDNAYMLIAEAFALPEIACDTCKTPCEKACRRGTVDNAVSIREIIREIAGMNVETHTGITVTDKNASQSASGYKTGKNMFQSRLGRFSASEKERLTTTVTTPSHCLHCACAGREKCKLRRYATAEGIKKSRFESSSALPAMNRQQINEKTVFEPAKCIRCGLCVYNSENGFTFKDRGFGMSVVLPDENRVNIQNELADLCPTGAIYQL